MEPTDYFNVDRNKMVYSCVTSVAVIALIYHNAVPRTQRWHTVIPGAVAATVMWFATTSLFGWYLHQSSEYDVIYGVLGVGIALLVWMYVVLPVVLVGAEFNAILFPRRVARRAARPLHAERSSTEPNCTGRINAVCRNSRHVLFRARW